MNDYSDYPISKNNRRNKLESERKREGSILRMGQPPMTAHTGLTKKMNKVLDERRRHERNLKDEYYYDDE